MIDTFRYLAVMSITMILVVATVLYFNLIGFQAILAGIVYGVIASCTLDYLETR